MSHLQPKSTKTHFLQVACIEAVISMDNKLLENKSPDSWIVGIVEIFDLRLFIHFLHQYEDSRWNQSRQSAMPNTDPRGHPILPKIGSHWPILTQSAVRHKIWAGEIAQLTKCLSCKHENLSSVLKIPVFVLFCYLKESQHIWCTLAISVLGIK